MTNTPTPPDQADAALREQLSHIFGLCSSADNHECIFGEVYEDQDVQLDAAMQLIAAHTAKQTRLAEIRGRIDEMNSWKFDLEHNGYYAKHLRELQAELKALEDDA